MNASLHLINLREYFVSVFDAHVNNGYGISFLCLVHLLMESGFYMSCAISLK